MKVISGSPRVMTAASYILRFGVNVMLTPEVSVTFVKSLNKCQKFIHSFYIRGVLSYAISSNRYELELAGILNPAGLGSLRDPIPGAHAHTILAQVSKGILVF